MALDTAPRGYSAARAVAPLIAEHFARHSSVAGSGGPPASSTIETIIDTAFWASLRREEKYVPRISIALLSPSAAERPLIFNQPLPWNAQTLVRISPAVERPGIHLGVWPQGDELFIWGIIRAVPMFAFVLEVAAPGLLVVKHHRGEVGKFINVAVLEGEHVKMIDEKASTLPDCPALLSSLLGLDAPSAWAGSLNVMVQMAASIRAHGRGGALLVVPSDTEEWRESILRPVGYPVSPPFTELTALMRSADASREAGWEDAVGNVVDALAGLTAVDGATILSDQYELLAFGAKIVRREGHPIVERVAVTEPVLGAEKAIVPPSTFGGTRHLSAVQFVHDQHDAIALVASQDGRFTVFAWSPCEMMVHGHRVETLLL